MGLQTTGDLWLGKLLKDFEPAISSEKSYYVIMLAIILHNN